MRNQNKFRHARVPKTATLLVKKLLSSTTETKITKRKNTGYKIQHRRPKENPAAPQKQRITKPNWTAVSQLLYQLFKLRTECPGTWPRFLSVLGGAGLISSIG
jgi:hypothetical protein